MLRPGQIIALCVLALLTIGVVMVNSADMRVVAPGPDGVATQVLSAQDILLSRTSIYMGLAVLAMTVAAFLPVRVLTDRAMAIADLKRSPRRVYGLLLVGAVGLVVACALVYVPGLGSEKNGSHRWLAIPGMGGENGLSVQPSEIAKWGMVGLMAWYCTALGTKMRDDGSADDLASHGITKFWTGLVPALIAIGAVAGFIVLEDLGTGALVGAVACLVLLGAGARWRQFALFVPFGVAAVVAAILTSDYRVKRILAFVNPYEDPEGIGYHTIQSLMAVANGGGWGRGLGHGLQKFSYLPEGRTDFIFAIICEELGIAGAAVVVVLFTVLLFAGLAVMRRERQPMLRLVALGVISTVIMQAMINLLVVTGLAPTKGIALPLLSSGGTGWILTAFSLGLVIAIDRTAAQEFSALTTAQDDATDAVRSGVPAVVGGDSMVEMKPVTGEPAVMSGGADMGQSAAPVESR